MTKLHQDNKAEPFFITAEAEAELIAAGYQFEPPSHFATMRLPAVLAGLTDAELATWPGELSKGEIERRRRSAFKAE
ncbi:hypothetical protein F0C76_09235 [Escherichia coli]|uniref:hypothetical protein n=1 Tax=Escherichia coli TaxID=562 RepID=UPI00025CAE69|nr:hypothetical protein [Escherichia coli]EBB7620048.1 hypothetical protein [Salmonella enterica]EBU9644561.1 hypothetical protein [Salmonella enterica subsp. enterica serovar Livingstone]EDY7090912.1 hypothetical protein [Salmonella enterica subsp. enterica serovar Litchfield]EFA6547017.1 hypothetical protein [Escherichia coli O157:H7]EHE8152592.1 hypothetical protein [Salmonella enterica subsp. enterica serovar Agona]MED6437792.1 hypothetical protein [Escherichia coli O157]